MSTTDYRLAQLEADDTPLLVRVAPAVFLAVATLAAAFAWGWWGGLFAFCLCSLLIYRDL